MNKKKELSKKDQIKLQNLLFKEFSKKIDLEEIEEKKLFKEFSASFFKEVKTREKKLKELDKILEIKIKKKTSQVLHSYHTGKKEQRFSEVFELSKKMREKNLASMSVDDQALFFSPILNKILKLKTDNTKLIGFHGKFYVDSIGILPFTHLEVPTHLFDSETKDMAGLLTNEFKSVFYKALKIYLGYQNSATGYNLEQFERITYGKDKNDSKTKKKKKK